MSKYQYNQKELNNDFGLLWSDYGARWYDLQRGIWGQIDPLAEKYYGWSGYNYVMGNPIKIVDLDGMAAYYLADGTYLFDSGTEDAVYYWNIDSENANNKAGGTGEFKQVGDLTIDQFTNLAGTLYAESDAKKYTVDEAAGIYSVLENRAKASNQFYQDKGFNLSTDNDNSGGITPCDIASDPNHGVYGWGARGKINDVSVNNPKRKAAVAGLILGVTSNIDYSNGAFFWHGRDLANKNDNAYKQFYLTGLKFSDVKHDIFKLGDHSVHQPGYSYTYETTAQHGKTTFMKLSNEWKSAAYPNNTYHKHKPW